MALLDIEARLRRLERQNRLMRLAAVGALAVIAVFSMMGQAAPKPKIIEAEQFNLVDGDGRVCAMLLQDGNGLPSLFLMDSTGVPRVILTCEEHGPRLMFRDQNKRSRISLGLTADGPSLCMFGNQDQDESYIAMERNDKTGDFDFRLVDKQDKERARLSLGADGPGIALKDATGRPRAIFSLDKNGSPSQILADANGDGRIFLGANPYGAHFLVCAKGQQSLTASLLANDKNGTVGFSLDDERGKPRFQLTLGGAGLGITANDANGQNRMVFGLDENGSPTQIFSDANGQVRLGLGQRKDHFGVDLFDAAGNSVWSVP